MLHVEFMFQNIAKNYWVTLKCIVRYIFYYTYWCLWPFSFGTVYSILGYIFYLQLQFLNQHLGHRYCKYSPGEHSTDSGAIEDRVPFLDGQFLNQKLYRDLLIFTSEGCWSMSKTPIIAHPYLWFWRPLQAITGTVETPNHMTIIFKVDPRSWEGLCTMTGWTMGQTNTGREIAAIYYTPVSVDRVQDWQPRKGIK